MIVDLVRSRGRGEPHRAAAVASHARHGQARGRDLADQGKAVCIRTERGGARPFVVVVPVGDIHEDPASSWFDGTIHGCPMRTRPHRLRADHPPRRAQTERTSPTTWPDTPNSGRTGSRHGHRPVSGVVVDTGVDRNYVRRSDVGLAAHIASLAAGSAVSQRRLRPGSSGWGARPRRRRRTRAHPGRTGRGEAPRPAVRRKCRWALTLWPHRWKRRSRHDPRGGRQR